MLVCLRSRCIRAGSRGTPPTMLKLEGRTAIVTGGAHGLGAVYAIALASEGAVVVVADIDDGEGTVKRVRGVGGEAISIRTDVSEETQVRALVEEVVRRYGRIDILVNNAALYASLPVVKFLDIDVNLWDRVMATNVRGPFLMVKHVAPVMIENRSGKIINIASGTAYKGAPPGMGHYITSKGAVVALTRALSRELGEHGICVNTLAPGLILNESILMNREHVELARKQVLASRAIKRNGLPSDVVGALLFLSSADSAFMTGQTIAVDGGSINT